MRKKFLLILVILILASTCAFAKVYETDFTTEDESLIWMSESTYVTGFEEWGPPYDQLITVGYYKTDNRNTGYNTNIGEKLSFLNDVEPFPLVGITYLVPYIPDFDTDGDAIIPTSDSLASITMGVYTGGMYVGTQWFPWEGVPLLFVDVEGSDTYEKLIFMASGLPDSYNLNEGLDSFTYNFDLSTPFAFLADGASTYELFDSGSVAGLTYSNLNFQFGFGVQGDRVTSGEHFFYYDFTVDNINNVLSTRYPFAWGEGEVYITAFDITYGTTDIEVVPEPATFAYGLLGLASVLGIKRKFKR